jgi:hypothetical protein
VILAHRGSARIARRPERHVRASFPVPIVKICSSAWRILRYAMEKELDALDASGLPARRAP